MPDLVFYQQKRYDGGVRIGLELDGLSVASQFEPPQGERDPSLLWFVDLRCSGTGVPDDPDAAFDWLHEHAATIREGFRRFSDKLHIGVDHDDDPLEWTDFGGTLPGVEMKIACSAIRRIQAREFSRVLADLGTRWLDYIEQLENLQEAEDLREPMSRRILDTSRLIAHFNKLKPLPGKTPSDAEAWADQLIKKWETRDIVSPVEVEFLCVLMNRDESLLREAFLRRSQVIDDHKIPPSDWEEARRLAKHAGFHARPRKLGDCLIQAIAERLNCDVVSLDMDFPRQHGRTRVGRRKTRKPNG